MLEESMKLTGRTAIVTGGAKGIGFGIARRFVAEGARVVIAEPHAAHYAASKGALVQLTKGMAVDLAPYNVLVNAIAPGPIATERSAPIFARPDQQGMLGRVLLGHPGAPNDVAAAAAFLASDGASFIQGTVLLVDGGFLAG